jgi:Domain of unknown function (DU1801)
MVSSSAATVEEYLSELAPDRVQAIAAVRGLILANLPVGFVEAMRWGMIAYEVPLAVQPETYNGQPLMYAALASQKHYMSLYLTSVYASPGLTEWFVSEYKKTGKRLDIGKSCVRFRKLENLPLQLVGEVIASTSLDEFVDLARR